jgi:hypothetical protein
MLPQLTELSYAPAQGRLQRGTVVLLCDWPLEEVRLNIAGQEVLVLRFVGEGGGDSGCPTPVGQGVRLRVWRWVWLLLINCHCATCASHVIFPFKDRGRGGKEKTGRLR